MPAGGDVHGEEVQPIVDALAARLGRSVAVDDPAIRLIAASRHFGDEDAVRVRSVLDRRVPATIVRWINRQGVAGWTVPGRLPENPELGMRPRICAPVRCNGMHLGYLWLLDPDGGTSEEELRAAGEAADAVGIALYRRMLLDERERSHEESALRLLLSPEPEDRRSAADEIRDTRLLADTRHAALLVVELDGDPSDVPEEVPEDVPEAVSAALEAAVAELRRSRPPRSTLVLARRHRAVVALFGGRPIGEAELLSPARRLRERFGELTGGRDCVIGVSASHQGGDAVLAGHREAGVAVRAARHLPMFGRVASWSSLGPFALLLRLDAEELARELPLPGVRELLTDHSALAATVEEFLDRAGDVAATSAALHIHRTTLYHRLRRVEAITGLRLDSGLDRLTLHLALKLAGFTGMA
ncbi:helix-turn-helix domain-containing protein [Pseudonocardia eucalypti]|uniref:Helix-turn-helix domain-containing protein n=1 Tax=Pseudonocardia eucalypti TaxID=648755 RepID=A0ABP9QVT4_9PSEU|nr:hypothetical protein [Pseudonocardia eucalypti]